jgi:hypothetical protein
MYDLLLFYGTIPAKRMNGFGNDDLAVQKVAIYLRESGERERLEYLKIWSIFF